MYSFLQLKIFYNFYLERLIKTQLYLPADAFNTVKKTGKKPVGFANPARGLRVYCKSGLARAFSGGGGTLSSTVSDFQNPSLWLLEYEPLYFAAISFIIPIPFP